MTVRMTGRITGMIAMDGTIAGDGARVHKATMTHKRRRRAATIKAPKKQMAPRVAAKADIQSREKREAAAGPAAVEYRSKKSYTRGVNKHYHGKK